MSDWTELNSPRAIVAKREINGGQGGATVRCVVLADGFILECGSGRHSENRAILLAEIINASGPERFAGKALDEMTEVPF
jgi:hypothetical protein